jgi:hypothetical protein
MTIDELRALQTALIERRQNEAAAVVGAYNDARIAKLNLVHVAIQALDAVITEKHTSKPSICDVSQ